MGKLDGVVCLVTGAAQGIGKGIVIRMAQEGARVAVNARLDEVGRLDVEVSADQVKRDGEEGSLRVVTRLRTSEGATGGGVKTCLVR